MEKDPGSFFSKFFKRNPDLNSVLEKIDSREIEGDYYAHKAIKGGIPGYVLRVRLFVPSVPRISSSRGKAQPIALRELWVEKGNVKLLIVAPPGKIDLSELRYDGYRLFVRRSDRRWVSFFVGLPVEWRKQRVSYSNGILQIVAPLRMRKKAATRA